MRADSSDFIIVRGGQDEEKRAANRLGDSSGE